MFQTSARLTRIALIHQIKYAQKVYVRVSKPVQLILNIKEVKTYFVFDQVDISKSTKDNTNTSHVKE